MTLVSHLREQLRDAYGYFLGAVANLAPEQAAWQPPGIAHPVGAIYAHLIISTDSVLHMFCQNIPPLLATHFAGKTGISDSDWAKSATLEWRKSVRVDLKQLRGYADAVYRAADDYLAALADADLASLRDLSMVGFGSKSVEWIAARLLIGHTDNITGEIAAVKGLQGLQGYPGGV